MEEKLALHVELLWQATTNKSVKHGFLMLNLHFYAKENMSKLCHHLQRKHNCKLEQMKMDVTWEIFSTPLWTIMYILNKMFFFKKNYEKGLLNTLKNLIGLKIIFLHQMGDFQCA